MWQMTAVKSVLIHGDILKLPYDFDTLLPNRSLPGGGRHLTRALGTKAVGERDDCRGRGYDIPHLNSWKNVCSQSLSSLAYFEIRKPCDRRPLQFIFVLLHLKTHLFALFLSIESKVI